MTATHPIGPHPIGPHPIGPHPIGPQSPSPRRQWLAGSATWNRGYLMAGVRAGLIALLLLVGLVLIILF